MAHELCPPFEPKHSIWVTMEGCKWKQGKRRERKRDEGLGRERSWGAGKGREGFQERREGEGASGLGIALCLNDTS